MVPSLDRYRNSLDPTELDANLAMVPSKVILGSESVRGELRPPRPPMCVN